MQTVVYQEIVITVRRATVRDDLHKQIITTALEKDVLEGTFGFWRIFAELCSQTVKAEGLPFDPTALVHADKAALDAAYEQFLDLDKALKDQWTAAVLQANQPVNEVDALPNP